MSPDTVYTLVSIVYVVICLFLIGVVLLQSGKGGGMGALGGGASGGQTVFGGAGAGNFLTRLTAVCAALFMILSATLAYLSTKGEQDAKAALAREGAAGQGTVSATGEDSEASADEGGDDVDDSAIQVTPESSEPLSTESEPEASGTADAEETPETGAPVPPTAEPEAGGPSADGDTEAETPTL